jgi:hypothetical protein
MKYFATSENTSSMSIENMNNLIDYCEGKKYLVKFCESRFAEWNGFYEFVSKNNDDEWFEYFTFKNSTTGLDIIICHSLDRCRGIITPHCGFNMNTFQLCKPSDIDGEGLYINIISFVDVGIIDEDAIREYRWRGRCDLLEATESQVSSKIDSVSQIVENRDLVRFIADYL